MSTKSEIKWFLTTFGQRISHTISSHPFSTGMLVGIAMQETGYLWKGIRKATKTETEFLAMCVGDTLGAKAGRRAFPVNRRQLEKVTDGKQMFQLARASLERLAKINSGYHRAASDPDKFCRGFGVFQLDLQYFRDDPDYFLNEGWTDFDACLAKAVQELVGATDRLGFGDRSSLSAREEASVAIAYNRGRYDPARGLKQGHRNSSGQYYGELVFDYIKIARSLADAIDLDELPPPKTHTIDPANIGVANAYVSTEGLRFRQEPNGTEIRELTIGEPVIDIGSAGQGGWRSVVIGRENGVVFGKYLRQPAADSVERLLRTTLNEWIRFKKGKADEKIDPYCGYVGEMWKSINKKFTYDGRSFYLDKKGRKTKNEVPWSAAFITYVVVEAGDAYAHFKRAASHSDFVNDAIGARVRGQAEKPFWGYRTSEVRPEVGDIIQRNRGKFSSGKRRNFSFDYAENHSSYPSHSDVVVEVTDTVVRVIGGNVGDTVSLSDGIKEYRLSADGYLASGQRIMAVLKNRSDEVPL